MKILQYLLLAVIIFGLFLYFYNSGYKNSSQIFKETECVNVSNFGNITQYILLNDFQDRELKISFIAVTRSSPIPIYIVDMEEVLKTYATKQNGDNYRINGFYSDQVKIKGFSQESIFIDDSIPPPQFVLILLHEISHYKCNNNGCKCYTDDIIREYHADLKVLEYCVTIKNKLLLQTFVQNNETTLNLEKSHKNNNFILNYVKAAKLIREHDLYKEALEILTYSP